MQGHGGKKTSNEFALEYVDRVNKMAEGRLRIDYLSAGAVVKRNYGCSQQRVLDAGHQVPCIGTKIKNCILFGSGPINGPIRKNVGLDKAGGGYNMKNSKN